MGKSKKPRKPKERAPRPPRKGTENVYFTTFERLVIESDRGCVLVAHAILDDALAALLENYFIATGAENKGEAFAASIDTLLRKKPIPPLGNFWVRKEMSFVLGLLHPETYEFLGSINDVRNEFAHPAEAAELHEIDIIRLMKASNYADARKKMDEKLATDMFLPFFDPVIERLHAIGDTRSYSDPRKQFMVIALRMIAIVNSRANMAKKCEPVAIEWKIQRQIKEAGRAYGKWLRETGQPLPTD